MNQKSRSQADRETIGLTIFIPVLNEQEWLEPLFEKLRAISFESHVLFEVFFSDGGSTDGSAELIQRTCDSEGQWSCFLGNLSPPSIGKTINQSIDQTRGQWVLLMPVDVFLSEPAWQSIENLVSAPGTVESGGFFKSYVPTSLLLRSYAAVQNWIRTMWLKNLVWTNAIFFRRSVLEDVPIPEEGFLEDVIFSDALKTRRTQKIFSAPVEVSARRYYPNRTVKRIFLNFLILTAYRLKILGIARLKQIYSK